MKTWIIENNKTMQSKLEGKFEESNKNTQVKLEEQTE